MINQISINYSQTKSASKNKGQINQTERQSVLNFTKIKSQNAEKIAISISHYICKNIVRS